MSGHASHGHKLGQRATPTYQSWRGMVQRCTNPKANGYRHYGGKGVCICERWRKFARFLADMGERPEGTTIDRIDVNGHYEPGNVRWATATTQMRNTSRNHPLTHEGRTMAVSAWAEARGMSASTLWNRIADGWSTADALDTPVGKYIRRAA